MKAISSIILFCLFLGGCGDTRTIKRGDDRKSVRGRLISQPKPADTTPTPPSPSDPDINTPPGDDSPDDDDSSEGRPSCSNPNSNAFCPCGIPKLNVIGKAGRDSFDHLVIQDRNFADVDKMVKVKVRIRNAPSWGATPFNTSQDYRKTGNTKCLEPANYRTLGLNVCLKDAETSGFSPLEDCGAADYVEKLSPYGFQVLRYWNGVPESRSRHYTEKEVTFSTIPTGGKFDIAIYDTQWDCEYDYQYCGENMNSVHAYGCFKVDLCVTIDPD